MPTNTSGSQEQLNCQIVAVKYAGVDIIEWFGMGREICKFKTGSLWGKQADSARADCFTHDKDALWTLAGHFCREHDFDNILTVFRVNLTTARVRSWRNNDIISTCFYCSWAIIHKYAFSSDSDHTFSRGCTLNRCRCSQSLKKD